jgi:site-specific recombinase XerD
MGAMDTTITIEVVGKRLFVQMPKNAADIQYIRSFSHAYWDRGAFRWIVPNYKRNLELLKTYFGERLTAVVYATPATVSPITDNRGVRPETLLAIKKPSGRMCLLFPRNPEVESLIHTFPYYQWDSHYKWWSIPFHEDYLEQLKIVVERIEWSFLFEEESADQDRVKRLTASDVQDYRRCPDVFILKLKELRYSERTLVAYKSCFEEFINYYHDFEIDQIDETMIVNFLRYLVTERKVSISYQNQSINAIKFYYEHVLRGQRKVYQIDRPQADKLLPVVLSEEEVAAILNATLNLKHKAILMTIYSAGLRVGEAVRLRINDIDSKRMQIRVVQSKGRKDRYTLLSKTTLEVLRSYFLVYHPKQWLFEGPDGGPYSDTSIQAVLRASVKRAGIKKHVTVHTLRHSFATHLLENRVDLRYIQSLLGHSSSITTEIYTHVTTKGFDQIVSPLDRLDLQGDK